MPGEQRSKFGGAEGSRTPDLLIANETLYQLSYDPAPEPLRLQNRPILQSDLCSITGWSCETWHEWHAGEDLSLSTDGHEASAC